MGKKKVFRSRISVVLIGLMLTIFIPRIPMFQERMFQDLYPLVGILLFFIFLTTGMRYIISGGRLFIKVWFIPCGRSMEITQIVSVKRSYNPLSSPAVSLKRLCISSANGRSWLISPVREKEFIEELKAINPDIYVNVPDKKGLWRIQDWDI